MKISTKGRYALRIMIDLAQHYNGDYVHLKDISKRQDITIKYMEQIMPFLTRAGYVRSSRGNNGGYCLAKDPGDYSAGEILRCAEGNLCPVACLEDDPVRCPRAQECRTLPFWMGMEKVINEYADSISLADLAYKGDVAQGI